MSQNRKSTWSVRRPDGTEIITDNLHNWCTSQGVDFFTVWSNQAGYQISRVDDFARGEVDGYVHVRYPDTGEVLVSQFNAVHLENFADTIALALMNFPEGHIHEMVFGNGASTVSGTGAITYLTPNAVGADAALYNQTFRKIVDNRSTLMLEEDRETNKIERKHVAGNVYTDMIVTCTLDADEPDGQDAFDDAPDSEGQFVFDEMGLKAFSNVQSGGKLLTHVIFHPVQKSLNRIIEIIYTLRIYMG